MRVVLTGLSENKHQTSSPASSLLSANWLACRNRKTHPSTGVRNPSHSVNKVNPEDGQRVLAYQLFQISKKVTSGELLYLKTCYEMYRSKDFGRGVIGQNEWLVMIGNLLGR